MDVTDPADWFGPESFSENMTPACVDGWSTLDHLDEEKVTAGLLVQAPAGTGIGEIVRIAVTSEGVDEPGRVGIHLADGSLVQTAHHSHPDIVGALLDRRLGRVWLHAGPDGGVAFALVPVVRV